jgi:PAS domain S-box-containing protein
MRPWLAASRAMLRRALGAFDGLRPPRPDTGSDSGPDHTLIGLEKAVETMQLGVTITDTAGRILYTNPADARMHGYAVEELIGQDVRVFAPGGAGKPLSRGELGRMTSWRRETVNVCKDGSTFSCHLMSDVVRDRNGEIVGVVTACEDISQRKAAEEALRESEERYALAASGANDGIWDWNLRSDAAYFSGRWLAVLGLAEGEIGGTPDAWLQRVHADDLPRVKSELAAHLDGRSPHFESEHRLLHEDGTYRWVLVRGLAVRDEHGAAYRMAGSLTDITGRKQAEEQLIHDALHDPLSGLPNRAFFMTLLDRAIKRTRRRWEYLFAVLFVDLDEVFTSASIGIALSAAGHERPEYFLRDADTAMYRAKARGKARYEMFDEAMHARAVAELRLETDLRQALERGEFRVRYQPIVSLDDARAVGFVALVRWQHGERGLVPPAEFIPVAEETGLIVPISRWVMETACRQTRAWLDRFPDLPDLSISVNLLARHFQQPDLLEQILGVLETMGLPARNLKLEITESVLMEDPESHVAVIGDLRRAGIQVLIDDFGTGYSSLSYLQRFSVDTLKIDRSFLVERGEGEGEGWDIVETIITLAEDLGVNVIAEGVETEEQNARLKQLRCAQAQGYLFREPVDAEAATALLAAQLARRRKRVTRA